MIPLLYSTTGYETLIPYQNPFILVPEHRSKTSTTTSTTTTTTVWFFFSTTRKIFRRHEKFRKKRSGRCDRFGPKIVEIGAILAIFEPFEVWNFCMPFFGEFGRSSQDLGESDYDSPKSWDDWLNSPKSGMCIVGDWSTRNFLFATQATSCFEHKECLASNTRNVLLGTQGMSCVEHMECPAWNTGNDGITAWSSDGMRTWSYDE